MNLFTNTTWKNKAFHVNHIPYLLNVGLKGGLLSVGDNSLTVFERCIGGCTTWRLGDSRLGFCECGSSLSFICNRNWRITWILASTIKKANRRTSTLHVNHTADGRIKVYLLFFISLIWLQHSNINSFYIMVLYI